MATTAAFRRLLLQGIQWDAQDKDLSLVEALKAACRAQLKVTKDGSFLIGTASNGKSAQFELPAAGRGCSPQEIAEETQRLHDLYQVAKTALIDGGEATPTDEQIVAEMKDRINPVRRYRIDHSALRRGPVSVEQEVELA